MGESGCGWAKHGTLGRAAGPKQQAACIERGWASRLIRTQVQSRQAGNAVHVLFKQIKRKRTSVSSSSVNSPVGVGSTIIYHSKHS